MKIVLLCLTLLLSSCALFKKDYTPEQIKKESARFNQFLEDEYEASVKRYPTWQTYLGRKTNYGKLNNETEAFAEEERQLSRRTLKRVLREFDEDALDEQSRLSYRMFVQQLKDGEKWYRWRYHGYPLNQLFGYQSRTVSFMINMHQVEVESHAWDYISRLREIKRVFDERMIDLKKRESKGIIPPKFAFPKIIQDSKNILTDLPLIKDFKRKVSKLKISVEKKKRLIREAEAVHQKFVEPAYQELITFMEGQEKRAKGNFGVWHLPNGRDYYNFSLSQITTTNMKASEIHQMGLDNVARIHDEMRAIMRQVDFKGTLQEFFDYMKTDKKFTYPNNQKGKNAYLKEANRVISEMKKALPKMFKIFPKAELVVKPVEAYREKSAGIAFYESPSLEGNRPGKYYVNLYKMSDVPRYRLEALAYHEALPGHHMQLAIQQELKNLPKFRRTGGYTAYSEGWGLYSELLPKEFGFYSDPYSDFGRLAMELWRACRLVVDTGIHAKRWSREKAIQYLKDNTPNAELEIIKGIERYFVIPGQATAYLIGMKKILELRERAKKKLGERFDIRDFHDVVLKSGALPLYVLEEQVDRWVKNSY